jgi:hypothetical protein
VDLRLTPSGVRIKRQQKVLEPELVAAVLARLDETKRRQALRGLELRQGQASPALRWRKPPRIRASP